MNPALPAILCWMKRLPCWGDEVDINLQLKEQEISMPLNRSKL